MLPPARSLKKLFSARPAEGGADSRCHRPPSVVCPGLVDIHVHFRETRPDAQGNHSSRASYAGPRRAVFHHRGLHAQHVAGRPTNAGTVELINNAARRAGRACLPHRLHITAGMKGEQLAPARIAQEGGRGGHHRRWPFACRATSSCAAPSNITPRCSTLPFSTIARTKA